MIKNIYLLNKDIKKENIKRTEELKNILKNIKEKNIYILSEGEKNNVVNLQQ